MAAMQKIRQPALSTIVFVVLLSVVGGARGREFLFPIVTHVGAHDSAMVVLNPSEFRVNIRMEGISPEEGGVVLNSSLGPNSMTSFGPDGSINPQDYRGGWGRVQYHFVDVPAADRERVKSLRLVGWTRLTLLGPNEQWPADPNNSVVAVANLPAVEAALEFRVPGILRPESEAAIAILNPSREPVRIELTLYNYSEPGSDTPYVQIMNTLSVPPLQRVSRFLWELMTEGLDDPPKRPDSWTSTRCTLRIRGSAPIAVGGLLYYRKGAFGNLPVVRVDQR